MLGVGMDKRQQYNSFVQSLARGVEVLKLLARHGPMTATALASELGLHQSSASRLLRSLQQAGLVHKPAYHSFSIDYGALLLAGVAMRGFGEVAASTQVAMEIHSRTGHGAAAAVLRENRLIYLAQVHPGANAAITLISDSSFPVHQSSLGLALALAEGKDSLRRVVIGSCKQSGVANPDAEAERTVHMACESMREHGFLFIKKEDGTFNGAMTFKTPRGTAGFAIYGARQDADVATVGVLLGEATQRINDLMEANGQLGKGE